MNVGILDIDSHNFPNLALMKVSSYHKQKGDDVEWVNHFKQYDKVYVSKTFGDEYSYYDNTIINAKEIVYGGTGFAINVVGGVEVYESSNDQPLPYEIEHCCPDYELYPEYKNAIGFLTRGCPNNCPFCIVSKKEGRISQKVANLDEWYRGQSHIDLLDPNILACKDRIELLEQLKETNARVNFEQGLDARFLNKEVVDMLASMKIINYHFAFDLMENKDRIVKGLELFRSEIKQEAVCYVLTNYNTTHEEDIERIKILQSLDILPYVMVYRKSTAPKITRQMQRWCNNRFIYKSCPNFEDYLR